VPFRYARKFLLVCVRYPISEGKNEWQNRVKNNPRGKRHPLTFFSSWEKKCVPTKLWVPRLWIRIYLQTMIIDTIVILSVWLHLLAYYSEEVWDWELGGLGDWECLWCTHLVSSLASLCTIEA
jgi:hypothetical protein